MSRDPLKAARAEVDALAAELASLEALAGKHAAAAGEAVRKHRQGDATDAELRDAVSARQAIDYARGEIARDLEAARAHVAELESAAADEVLLADIAAGTVEYRSVEAAHLALLDETERAIARAIHRSKELTAAAAAARTRARDAALALAARHGNEPEPGHAPVAELARAVAGTDVRPLAGGEEPTRWPYGRRNRYRLVSQVAAATKGVQVAPVEDGDAAA